MSYQTFDGVEKAQEIKRAVAGDMVHHPRHYMGDGKIECKDAVKSMMHGADITNNQAGLWYLAFRYLWRWPWKNGIQDLEKCKQCIDFLIEDLKEEGEE